MWNLKYHIFYNKYIPIDKCKEMVYGIYMFFIFTIIDQILVTSHFICMSDWVEY